MCSCGYFYQIGDCGKPTEIKKCLNCGNDIGGNNYRLVNTSMRIYRDINQKNNNYGIQGLTLDELRNQVAQIYLNEKPGFINSNLNGFLDNNKNVRNLNNITYRILSFIFYSILYYNNIIDNINDNNIKNYYISNKNILEILIIIWNSLKSLLTVKGINNIKIFINSLFPKINDLIKNTEITNTKEKRLNYEKEFNIIINECLNDFQNYFNIYNKTNNKILQIKTVSLKSIITEQDFPNLPENQFPFIKYFTVPTFSDLETFNKIFENNKEFKDKYPIINYYLYYKLIDKEDISKIKFIKDLNSLENYLLEKYSLNITREDATKLIIKDEIVSKNDNYSNAYQDFEKAYNELKQYSGRLGCHVLKTHQLNNIDPLSYILNDNIKEGMNLAAIYQYFIDFQNNFINNIFGQKLLHKDLGYFSEGINNAIYIQDANINDIVSLQINTPLFKEFEQIISIYSKREIFGKNEINYYIIKILIIT